MSEFVYLPWKHATETAEMALTQPPNTQGLSLAAMQAQADAGESRWLAQQIEGYFTDKLLRLTREINKHLGEDSTSDAAAFPTLAGSHLTKKARGPACSLALPHVSCRFAHG